MVTHSPTRNWVHPPSYMKTAPYSILALIFMLTACDASLSTGDMATTWTVTEIKVNIEHGAPASLSAMMDYRVDATFALHEEGTFKEVNSLATVSGTWTYEESSSILTLSYSDDPDDRELYYIASGDEGGYIWADTTEDISQLTMLMTTR